MSDAKTETPNQSGFATNDLQRKAGDVIKSKDWNTLVDEIGRLGTDKVDLMKGAQTPPGSLAIAGPLTVLDGGNKDSTPSMVIQKDKGGALGAELALVNNGGGPDSSVAIDFGVGRGVQANGEGNAQIRVTNLGPDNATKMSFSTWGGKSFDERITLLPGVVAIPPGLGMGVGIGTMTPSSTLDVQGEIRCSERMGIGPRSPEDLTRSTLDVRGDIMCSSSLQVHGDVRCNGELDGGLIQCKTMNVHGDIQCSGRLYDRRVIVITKESTEFNLQTPEDPGNYYWIDPRESLDRETGIQVTFPSRQRDCTLLFALSIGGVQILGGIENVTATISINMNGNVVTHWDTTFNHDPEDTIPPTQQMGVVHVEAVSLPDTEATGNENYVSVTVKLFINKKSSPGSFKIRGDIPNRLAVIEL